MHSILLHLHLSIKAKLKVSLEEHTPLEFLLAKHIKAFYRCIFTAQILVDFIQTLSITMSQILLVLLVPLQNCDDTNLVYKNYTLTLSLVKLY